MDRRDLFSAFVKQFRVQLNTASSGRFYYTCVVPNTSFVLQFFDFSSLEDFVRAYWYFHEDEFTRQYIKRLSFPDPVTFGVLIKSAIRENYKDMRKMK